MSTPICKVWDAEQGKYIGIPALKGTDGKSAYQYAQEGGYTGTETEFAEKLAAEKFANPNALTFTGAVTGSYDGSAPMSVNIPTAPTKTSQLTNDSGFLTSHQSLAAYRTAAAQDVIDSGKVDKVTGKGLSTNDYTAAAKAKVDAIPANPKYTDTVYDDTALKERVATIEGKESAWDAKSDFSGSYNDLTDKPTIPTALPNPNAITFTGAVTGSYDGSTAKTVNIPSAVTDAHINSLIDTKLGVIENGSY